MMIDSRTIVRYANVSGCVKPGFWTYETGFGRTKWPVETVWNGGAMSARRPLALLPHRDGTAGRGDSAFRPVSHVRTGPQFMIEVGEDAGHDVVQQTESLYRTD